MKSDVIFPREGAEWTNIWFDEGLYFDRTRVALIGDSITHHYRPVVQRIVKEEMNLPISVDMMTGSRCAGDPALYAELECFFGSANGYKYDVIHFNNGLHGACNNSMIDYDVFCEGFVKCVELLHKLQPQAKIILSTLTDMNYGEEYISREGLKAKNDLVDERDAFIRKYAKENGYVLDDLRSLVCGKPDLYPQIDGIHYGEAGVRAMAEQVTKIVLDAIDDKDITAGTSADAAATAGAMKKVAKTF